MRALELVDSILEAVRTDFAAAGMSRVADCVQQAISDLGEVDTEIVASVTGEFPVPPEHFVSCSGTCSQTPLRPAPIGFTSPLSLAETSAYSSSTTTVSGWNRPPATPPGLSWDCASAVASSNGAGACSS